MRERLSDTKLKSEDIKRKPERERAPVWQNERCRVHSRVHLLRGSAETRSVAVGSAGHQRSVEGDAKQSGTHCSNGCCDAIREGDLFAND